jgi:hypothetical protein
LKSRHVLGRYESAKPYSPYDTSNRQLWPTAGLWLHDTSGQDSTYQQHRAGSNWQRTQLIKGLAGFFMSLCLLL